VSTIEWREDVPAADWDAALATLGGHPLQSALWGDARRSVDGIHDHRWLAMIGPDPVWMIRIEERRLPALGWIGWVPRGPTGRFADNSPLVSILAERLKRLGAKLLITDPWQAAATEQLLAVDDAKRPRTIWIDIGLGQGEIWNKLDKQWRYGVRRAQRLGVAVGSSGSDSDVESFFELCAKVSRAKGFRLPASLKLMKCLLASGKSESVEARLFLARHEKKLGSGIFVIRCGKSMHYFWGGLDRALSRQRVGEAVQWAAIEWALAQGCQRYDLGGISPKENPTVYEFKKKMGGIEVTLVGRQRYPFGLGGRIVGWMDAAFH